MTQTRLFLFATLAIAAGTACAQHASDDTARNDENQPAAQGRAGDPRADNTPDRATASSNSKGAQVGPMQGNRKLGTNVRGAPESSSTSDRQTSRTWSGVGSTGGATGTGTSSGTSADPQTEGGPGTSGPGQSR